MSYDNEWSSVSKKQDGVREPVESAFFPVFIQIQISRTVFKNVVEGPRSSLLGTSSTMNPMKSPKISEVEVQILLELQMRFAVSFLKEDRKFRESLNLGPKFFFVTVFCTSPVRWVL